VVPMRPSRKVMERDREPDRKADREADFEAGG
jgi:hypothetical protein